MTVCYKGAREAALAKFLLDEIFECIRELVHDEVQLL